MTSHGEVARRTVSLPTPSDAPGPEHLSATVSVAVADLRPADSPRVPVGDPDHLRALAAWPGELPPIIVHRPSMRVIDGTYRLRVAVLRGATRVAARFFDGSPEDAFVLAVTANAGHGLPLTPAERSAAAARIVASHPHWSDRSIGAVTGLSAHAVAALRRRNAIPAADARVGRDGRVRPLSTAAERREARRLLAEAPELSLRQVARLTGLSPATVRDVRDRVSRGEDPVPKRLRRPAAVPAPPGPSPRRQSGRPADGQRGGGAVKEFGELYGSLCGDPALRHSESGRALLRLLGQWKITAEEWGAMADAVPGHRREDVAEMALACVRLWESLAEAMGTAERAPRRRGQ
ncbi:MULTISPECIES: ParB/RepB/Spo0J family partition protein [unclassified Streptomyces]|uniref:ParB/RepB/Spo0J family partition protein n=1 Tax=unclassified Streptomyces TaxID=2593676 RepID=UPI0022B62688|nr:MULTISPECIES: transcriptional regulator [unclassified Streptomyces]MCZ7416817.1 transcriptional regulator [Streptomyces sp. WMMC897]MCZ7433373.1 transcriptional regulator [Streptomyces sp. WMMC1477]